MLNYTIYLYINKKHKNYKEYHFELKEPITREFLSELISEVNEGYGLVNRVEIELMGNSISLEPDEDMKPALDEFHEKLANIIESDIEILKQVIERLKSL